MGPCSPWSKPTCRPASRSCVTNSAPTWTARSTSPGTAPASAGFRPRSAATGTASPRSPNAAWPKDPPLPDLDAARRAVRRGLPRRDLRQRTPAHCREQRLQLCRRAMRGLHTDILIIVSWPVTGRRLRARPARWKAMEAWASTPGRPGRTSAAAAHRARPRPFPVQRSGADSCSGSVAARAEGTGQESFLRGDRPCVISANHHVPATTHPSSSPFNMALGQVACSAQRCMAVSAPQLTSRTHATLTRRCLNMSTRLPEATAITPSRARLAGGLRCRWGEIQSVDDYEARAGVLAQDECAVPGVDHVGVLSVKEGRPRLLPVTTRPRQLPAEVWGGRGSEPVGLRLGG